MWALKVVSCCELLMKKENLTFFRVTYLQNSSIVFISKNYEVFVTFNIHFTVLFYWKLCAFKHF